MASDVWVTRQKLNEMAKGRKVIFWGIGEYIDKTLERAALDTAFIVDNNVFVQGTEQQGMGVYGPDKLKEIDDFSLYLIVISTTGFRDVINQLQGLGYEPVRDFVVCPALSNFAVIDEVDAVTTTLLCSCYQPESDNFGGGLYLYHTADYRLEKVLSGRSHGLARFNDGFLVIDDAAPGMRILNKDLSQAGIMELPKKIRPHGVGWDFKRGLAVVGECGIDAVGFYELDTGKLVNRISISDKYQVQGEAQHHLNDVWVDGDSLFVSMFSFTGNWLKGAYDGGILEYNIETGQCYGQVVRDLWCPHSVMIIDKRLCYLDSMRGIVYNTSAAPLAKIPGWARGLDFDGKYYYVAQSLHRHFHRLAGIADNIPLNAGVYLIDPDRKVTRFFAMPEITNIHAMLCYGKD